MLRIFEAAQAAITFNTASFPTCYGQLFTNAAHGVRVIKSSRIEHKAPVPSKEAIRALIEAADEDFKPHLIVSALGGLRASELRGLRWQDVDFDKGFIHIRQRADAYNRWASRNRGQGSATSRQGRWC